MLKEHLKLTDAEREALTAFAGHARWGLRLLADKVVELGYCDSISHTQVGHILKKTS